MSNEIYKITQGQMIALNKQIANVGNAKYEIVPLELKGVPKRFAIDKEFIDLLIANGIVTINGQSLQGHPNDTADAEDYVWSDIPILPE